MMKCLALFILYFLPFCLSAQVKPSKPVVKERRVHLNKKLVCTSVYDKNGNLVFCKNDGLSGPVTMIFFSEYDSLNREVYSVSVHSNFGYSLGENVYRDNRAFRYISLSDSLPVDVYSREYLRQVQSAEDFLALNPIKQLVKRGTRLASIEELDDAGNVVSETCFSEKGDTSSINKYQYNGHNKNTCFHMGSVDDDAWRYNIHYIYANEVNLIKSYRVYDNNPNDTNEVHLYIYNSVNQLVSESYYHKAAFVNKTNYVYNTKQQLVKELFYEGNEPVAAAETRYKYDFKEALSGKTIIYNRRLRPERDEVYQYSYRYWL